MVKVSDVIAFKVWFYEKRNLIDFKPIQSDQSSELKIISNESILAQNTAILSDYKMSSPYGLNCTFNQTDIQDARKKIDQ